MKASALFLTLSRLACSILTSPDVALLLGFLTGLFSRLRLHQEDFPAPSFGILTNFWWRERLCRIEFWNGNLISIELISRGLWRKDTRIF